MTTPIEPPTPPVPAPPAGAEGLVPQDAVTRIAAREHDAGIRKGAADAEARFAAELGVPLADAKRILAEHQAAQDAAKTNEQRALEAAAAAKVDADSRVAAALADAHSARVEAALLQAGVALPEGGTAARDETRASALAKVARLVEAQPGSDPAAIAKAVGELRGQMPTLFGATAGAAGGDPGRGPRPSSGSGAGGMAAGAEMARAQAARSGPAVHFEGGRPVWDYSGR